MQITAGCLQTFLDWLCGEQRFRAGQETFLNQAPFSFDLSVMDLYGSLASGGTLYSITRGEIANFKTLFQSLYDSSVTVWVSTPSFAQVCLLEKTFGAGRLPDARKFLFCGETLHPGTARQLLDRFPGAEVWNTYGPTEATVAATSVRVDHALLALDGPLPVGYPMPTGTIEIHDERGPRPTPGRAWGNHHRRSQRESRVHRAARSDRARLSSRCAANVPTAPATSGTSMNAGPTPFPRPARRPDQAARLPHRTRGHREQPAGPARTCARRSCMPVVRGGTPQWLDAYVTLTTGNPPAGTETTVAARLREGLTGKLPGYMLPRSIHFVAALPLTANGKVDRRQLREAVAGR